MVRLETALRGGHGGGAASSGTPSRKSPYRQRQKYFSTSHAAKQRAAPLASHLRTRAAGRGSCASEVPAEGSTAWMNATLEPWRVLGESWPTNQANPIQRELAPTVETLAAEEQARAGGGA